MTDKKTVDIKSRLKNNSKIFDALQQKREQAKIQKNEAVIELFQNYIYLKRKDIKFSIDSIKSLFKNYEEKLSNTSCKENPFRNNVTSFVWGIKPNDDAVNTILKNVYNNKDTYFVEDTFLRSVVGGAHELPANLKKYQVSCGYIFDDLTSHYDGTRPSRIEFILNSDFKITENEKNRSKQIINELVENKISKYNSQPVYEPQIGRNGHKKILVVDQSYGDYSIVRGCADDNTFKIMLQSAIEENPDADIIVKTHPDSIGKDSLAPKCYYSELTERNNVYKLTEAINPYSIIEYVDKVYVCSSQFGFEALMAGKEVHTFGLPFYANWGLTIDAQTCARRTRKRTLEEIFYVSYIMMSQYVNPKTEKLCEIEDAIEYLKEMRAQYFKEVKND